MEKLNRVLLYILLFTFFLICFSPGLFVKLITGHLDDQLRNLYWERRMQAMALFVGIGLIASGIDVIRKKRVGWGVHYLWKKKNRVELTGKEAVRNGLLAVVIGIIITVWSIPFWVQYVIPVILSK